MWTDGGGTEAAPVRLQEGAIAGTVTDDAILAGMAAQDPSLHIVGGPLGTEPDALGLPPERPVLGDGAGPPDPVYER